MNKVFSVTTENLIAGVHSEQSKYLGRDPEYQNKEAIKM